MRETNYSRRDFLSGATMSLGAEKLAMFGFSPSQFANYSHIKVMDKNFKKKPFDTIKPD
jgi:hypothetical protein